MLKRFLPLAAALVLTLPAPAFAQGVTSSADSRATEAGREILHQGGTAADAAVAAAERILRDSVKGSVADDLVSRGINDIKTKLN